jgi:hypothetical protein
MLIEARFLRPARNRSTEALEADRARKRHYFREFDFERSLERRVEHDDAGAVVGVGPWMKRTTRIPVYLLDERKRRR